MVNCKHLKVGLYNAGSLGTNHDNFIASVARSNLDFLAVNETWLKIGEEEKAPEVPGYKLRHVPRPKGKRSRGGGVGFFIRRNCNMCVRTYVHPVDPLHRSVEQMWLTLTLGGKKIVIGTAYRPPWMDIDVFFDAISDTISSIPNYDNLILLADMNINFLITDDSRTRRLINFLECFNLTQQVTEPTHFTNTSQTLIDVICTDLSARKVTLEHVGSLFGHCLVMCEFKIKREKLKPCTISYRPKKNINLVNFNNDLKSSNWNEISSYNNVNEMVRSLNAIVVSLFDLHAPVKSVIVKHQSYPWITDVIKLMMKLRDEAAAVYHKTNSETKKEYYKSLKSVVKTAIFIEKSTYFKYNINNNIHDSKHLWKSLKNTILPKNNTELPSFFNDPNLINHHFLHIPGKVDVSISQLTYYEHNKFSDAVFHIEPITLDRMLNIIKKLKSNAEGCDTISLDMLTMTFPDTVESIRDIINTSIATCTFPDIWKLAIVRPLPKHSAPVELKDLRPISILPCMSKIMEKAVCVQLTAFIENNCILPEAQSGFRKGRSTTTALLDVTDTILCDQDQGMGTLLVLLDFSRAFDSLNLNLLLSKLNYYGFDSEALRWFNSYLSHRCQCVKLNLSDGSTLTSDIVPVRRGVPQGSILGPLLFILYSADIAAHIVHCKFHIYADDIQVYISFKPSEVDSAIEQLNEDLGRIAAWSVDNCLLLNPLKTKLLVVGSVHQLATMRPTTKVMLMGEQIERIYEARNLGLLMDSNLRFEKHVANTVRSCFYKLKVLYKIRPYIIENLRVRLVESLILSKLNYVDIVIGPRLLVKTQRLVQRVQNACARFCFNVPSRAHVTPYLNKNLLLKMKHRRKHHLACLLFGIIKHERPSYLFEKLRWSCNQRPRAARQCAPQLLTHRHRSMAFRGSFRYSASKCWNNIPPPIRNLQTLHQFRFKLKIFLLEHQQSEEALTHDTSAI